MDEEKEEPTITNLLTLPLRIQRQIFALAIGQGITDSGAVLNPGVPLLHVSKSVRATVLAACGERLPRLVYTFRSSTTLSPTVLRDIPRATGVPVEVTRAVLLPPLDVPIQETDEEKERIRSGFWRMPLSYIEEMDRSEFDWAMRFPRRDMPIQAEEDPSVLAFRGLPLTAPHLFDAWLRAIHYLPSNERIRGIHFDFGEYRERGAPESLINNLVATLEPKTGVPKVVYVVT